MRTETGLELNGFDFEKADIDGDVGIFAKNDSYNQRYIYKSEIPELIEFLQEQIKSK